MILDYPAYEREARRFSFSKGEPTNERIFVWQADYCVEILNAVRSQRIAVYRASARFHGSDTYNYLTHGAGRRLIAIETALESVLDIIPPNQTVPIGMKNVHKVSNDLNTIYINVRGLLDNYAWALVASKGGAKALSLSYVAVGIFDKRLWAALAMPTLESTVMAYAPWNSDMKERRDPAAHRIPLSVPPSVLTQADLPTYREREAAMYNEQRRAGELALAGKYEESQLAFAEAGQIADELNSIGSCWPVFHHHPDDGTVAIYPTVPEDIGKALIIAIAIESAM